MTDDRIVYDRDTGQPLGVIRMSLRGRYFIRHRDRTITPARWETADDAEKALREGSA